METGYDILFFWVARMMMMGLHFMGEVPFRRVLLSGMVIDEHGEKMSKVKGNVIDPLDLVYGATLDALIATAPKRAGTAKSGMEYLRKTYPEGFPAYGADALRFTLLSYSPQTTKIALSLKRIEGYRNFCNKLWNAARYALMAIEGSDAQRGRSAAGRTQFANRWILSRLGAAIDAARAGSTNTDSTRPSGALYHFVWNELCDWYLELSQAAACADQRCGHGTRDARDAAARARDRAARAAPDDAVHHRRDLAAPAQASRCAGLDHDRALPASERRRRQRARRRAGDGAPASGDRRRTHASAPSTTCTPSANCR